MSRWLSQAMALRDGEAWWCLSCGAYHVGASFAPLRERGPEMRYFVSVMDGIVDGVRRTVDDEKVYTHVVHRQGGLGWFATFHATEANAKHSLGHLFQSSIPGARLDVAHEVNRDYQVGESFDPLTLVRALTADGHYQERSE